VRWRTEEDIRVPLSEWARLAMVPGLLGWLSTVSTAFENQPADIISERQWGIIGGVSEVCFFACLATFFSLGVIAGDFFCSLLLCLVFVMIALRWLLNARMNRHR
jgi:fluoride ion exporter CrcB/FEX